MYKVAFQFQAAADSANNKVKDVIRAAVHPQINKRLVDQLVDHVKYFTLERRFFNM
jgi:hypothetical protein